LSLIKEKYLKEMRAKIVKEKGYDISDEDWNKIVSKIENEIRKKLKKSSQSLMFSLYKIAEEESNLVMEIDGVNIGATIRQLRPIYEWLIQKRKYFGW